jgi:hypothetical protein
MIELAEALAGRPGNQHLHLDLARPLNLRQDPGSGPTGCCSPLCTPELGIRMV